MTLFDGLLSISDWQFYLMVPGGDEKGDIATLYGPERANGFEDYLVFQTGMGYGEIPLTINYFDVEPAVDTSTKWDHITHVLWTITESTVYLDSTNGQIDEHFSLPTAGQYGIRYYGANVDAGFEQDTTAEAPAPDYYRIELWPAS